MTDLASNVVLLRPPHGPPATVDQYRQVIGRVSATAVRLYGLIESHAAAHAADPVALSTKTMAATLGLTASQVARHLSQLVVGRYIRYVRQSADNPSPSRYQVTRPLPSDGPTTVPSPSWARCRSESPTPSRSGRSPGIPRPRAATRSPWFYFTDQALKYADFNAALDRLRRPPWTEVVCVERVAQLSGLLVWSLYGGSLAAAPRWPVVVNENKVAKAFIKVVVDPES